MSSVAPEQPRPQVCHLVMRQLGAKPGPVSDIFLVKTVFWHDKTRIFNALHVLNKLIDNEFKFVVNQSFECQLFVKCTTRAANEKLEDALPHTFKFDNLQVRIIKLARIDLLPFDKDIYLHETIQMFSASCGTLSVDKQRSIGYPVGYSDILMDLESVQKPTLSETAMNILGVVEGKNNGLMRVKLKHIVSSEFIPHVYFVVPWIQEYKFAVDQNGAMYIKFDNQEHADTMEKSHYLVHGVSLKFYSVKTVTKENYLHDKGKKCPLYSRTNKEDHFERHGFTIM